MANSTELPSQSISLNRFICLISNLINTLEFVHSKYEDLQSLSVFVSHVPQLSTTASPPQSPLQSFSQSFVLSLSQVPQLSAKAEPPHTPKQSATLPSQSHSPAGMPEPSHTPHSSSTKVPFGVPAQSEEVELLHPNITPGKT